MPTASKRYAEPYFREALEGRRHVYGDVHPATLESINEMGVQLRLMGRLEDAEQYHHEAVQGARQVFWEGHWNNGEFLVQHARTLSQLERFDEAESAGLEARASLEAALGPAHERTVDAIKTLAEVYDAWASPTKPPSGARNWPKPTRRKYRQRRERGQVHDGTLSAGCCS